MIRTCLLAVALFTACLALSFGCGNRSEDSGSSDELSNVIALHKSDSPLYNNDCLSCHSDVLTQETLNPAIPEAHTAMLADTPGATTEEKCIYCHSSTDILQHSAGNIRKNVAADTCDVCHGPEGPGAQYYE